MNFIAILQVCENTEKKRIQTLAVRISETARVISFKFGMYTPLVYGKPCSKFGSNWIRDHRDTKV